jgi:thiol-disulfide isomerase/thioredoxin
MRRLARAFSAISFFWTALPVGGLLGLWLAQDGFGLGDGVLLTVYAGLSVAALAGLRTPARKGAPLTEASSFEQSVRADGRPTLVEFYSDLCAACLASRPLVDQLEAESAPRLRVLRVNVREPGGDALAERYRVTFTPTFVLFDGRGEKVEEFLYIVNRARLLYWLNRQPSAG